MHIKSIAFSLLSVCFILISCKSTKGIEGVWRSMNVEAQVNYSLFAILTISNGSSVAEEKEEFVVKQLKENGKKALSLHSFTSNEEVNLNKQIFLDEIASKNADVVLTINTIPGENATHFKQDAGEYSPILKFGWYGSIWGYYSHWFTRKDMLQNNSSTQNYYEINLYDVRSESLIWSAQSILFEQNEAETTFEEFVSKSIKQMRKDGFLYNPED